MNIKNDIKITKRFFFLALIFFAVEFFLFHSLVSREITNYFPANFDQASYLYNTYVLYHNVITTNFLKGIYITPAVSTGILFPIQGALLLKFFGLSRFSVLTLNFIYYAALQISIIIAARSLSDKLYVPMLALGLLFCVSTPFLPMGGIADFRMDFAAFCLYGIFISCVIKSKIFSIRKWSVISALIASLLILTRVITITYLGLNLLSLLLYLYLATKSSSNENDSRIEQKKNLFWSGVIVVIITLPWLFLNRLNIYNYYVGNHVFGSEKYIRQAELGITGFSSSMLYYPKSIIFDHLGLNTLYYCALILAIVFLMNKPWSKLNKCNYLAHKFSFKTIYIFLGLSILAPLFFLTMDISKSPVVGGIVVVPFLWLIICLFVQLDQRRVIKNQYSNKLIYLVACIIFSVGLTHQIHSFRHHSHAAEKLERGTITRMYDDIGNYAVAQKWPKINLSTNKIMDFITSDGIADLYFERHGVLLDIVIQPLGGSIFAISPEKALMSLQNSNLVILNDKLGLKNSPFPFDHSVQKIELLLQNYVQKYFVKLGDYPYQGTSLHVYVRKDPQYIIK